MSRKLRTLIASVFGCFLFAPSLSAATMPAIQGTVEFDGGAQPISSIQLALFEDDGNGNFDSGDVPRGTTTSNDDGSYEFSELDPDARYFIVAGGEVSELHAPLTEPRIVDSFDITQAVVANPISGGRTDSVSGPGHMILGGHRDLYLEVTGGVAEAKLRANPFSIGSNLQLELSAGVTGLAVVTWDGVAGAAGKEPDAGLGNYDLTNGGMYQGVMMRFAVDAAGGGQPLELRLHSDSGVSRAEFEFPVIDDVDPVGFAYVPFTQFVGDASPAAVNAIQLVVDAQLPSLDAQIDMVGLTGPAEVNFVFVPEPGALSLGIYGWLLTALWRRRRQAT